MLYGCLHFTLPKAVQFQAELGKPQRGPKNPTLLSIPESKFAKNKIVFGPPSLMWSIPESKFAKNKIVFGPLSLRWSIPESKKVKNKTVFGPLSLRWSIPESRFARNKCRARFTDTCSEVPKGKIMKKQAAF
jgi:hypothetical protein